jgi:hypothetical protein
MKHAIFAEMLIDVTSRAIGVRPEALGLSPPTSGGAGSGSVEESNLIIVADGPPPSRLPIALWGRTIDIVLESRESLAAELDRPASAALIRLVAGTHVVYEQNGLLSRAAERARDLLAAPPPRSIYQNEIALAYEIRDGAATLPAEPNPLRALLRGALLERIIHLAFIRSRCWPVPLRHAVNVLSARDAKLGARVVKAVHDDEELQELAWDLTTPPIFRPEKRPKQPLQRPSDPAALKPPDLARLPAAAAATICVDDLRRMSKLQMLTVRHVHGATMGVPEQKFIEEALAG